MHHRKEIDKRCTALTARDVTQRSPTWIEEWRAAPPASDVNDDKHDDEKEEGAAAEDEDERHRPEVLVHRDPDVII